jgi:hypothetical protein
MLSGPQSRCERCGEERNLAPTRNPSPAVQPLACRYTDWATPTPNVFFLHVGKGRFQSQLGHRLYFHRFFVVFLSPPCSTPNYATTASFDIICNSLFIIILTSNILLSKLLAQPLNKVETNKETKQK